MGLGWSVTSAAQVFGESILNDAVAIVLTTTVLESEEPHLAELTGLQQLWQGTLRFVGIFIGSAGNTRVM